MEWTNYYDSKIYFITAKRRLMDEFEDEEGQYELIAPITQYIHSINQSINQSKLFRVA